MVLSESGAVGRAGFDLFNLVPTIINKIKPNYGEMSNVRLLHNNMVS